MTSKKCEVCGKQMKKNRHGKAWEKKRFCSHKCRAQFATTPIRERLENKIYYESNSGCWLFGGADNGRGYGVIKRDMKAHLAHRVSWGVFRGSIPPGMHVLHKCDTPACVNPDHLFLGTNLENVEDKIRKGRAFDTRGENSPTAMLTETMVHEIRSDTRSNAEVAKELGVATSTVRNCRTRQSWGHIT